MSKPSHLDPAMLATLIATLERHLAITKRAYHLGQRGWSYEDCRQAAARLLVARGMWEEASGRPVVSKPTARQIAHLLR
jgi:hypothetical protein